MNKLISKEKSILEVISATYIFIIILIFPLIVDKTGFFHILECKWYSYIAITATYIVSCCLIVLYFHIFKKVNYLKKIKLTKIQWAAIIFLLVNVLSYLFSPYRQNHNLLVGGGRGEGLIVSSLYILSFLLVSVFAKFKKGKVKPICLFGMKSSLLNIALVISPR